MPNASKSSIVFGILAGALIATIGVEIRMLTADLGSTQTVYEQEERTPPPFTDDLHASSLREQKEQWATHIDTVGAEYAYEDLKTVYENAHFGVQHSMAHVFGELLYVEMGIDGVAVCVSTFAFGCYHSFFGTAIAENGIEVLQALDQACFDKWGLKGLGCPHGIGHGVLVYMDEENLRESLEACTALKWQEPIGGCTSGVLMEYNFRTMSEFDGKGAGLRAFDPADTHAPCSWLPERFIQACYYEQPQWWVQVIGWDFSKIGQLCNEAATSPGREACYLGIGNAVVPGTDYNVEESTALCEEMPTREGEILCLAGSSWSFSANPDFKHLAPAICDGLDAEDSQYCTKRSDVI